MRFIKSAAALGIIGVLGTSTAVQAQNFASFDFLGTNTKFLYTDGVSGGSSADTLGLATLSGTTVTPVTSALANFRYLTPNGADGFSNFLANVTLSAQSTTSVAPSTGTQSFTNVTISFTNATGFTSNNGVFFAAGTANLLTMTVATPTGATGILSGVNNNSTSLSFSGAVSNPTTPSVVGYTSDFLDFSGTSAGNAPGNAYDVSVTNARQLANNTAGISRQGSNATSFYGDVTLGTFAATGPIGPLDPTPAPPGVVSGLIGIAMGGAQFGYLRFRRRRAKKSETTEAAA